MEDLFRPDVSSPGQERPHRLLAAPKQERLHLSCKHSPDIDPVSAWRDRHSDDSFINRTSARLRLTSGFHLWGRGVHIMEKSQVWKAEELCTRPWPGDALQMPRALTAPRGRRSWSLPVERDAICNGRAAALNAGKGRTGCVPPLGAAEIPLPVDNTDGLRKSNCHTCKIHPAQGWMGVRPGGLVGTTRQDLQRGAHRTSGNSGGFGIFSRLFKNKFLMFIYF